MIQFITHAGEIIGQALEPYIHDKPIMKTTPDPRKRQTTWTHVVPLLSDLCVSLALTLNDRDQHALELAAVYTNTPPPAPNLHACIHWTQPPTYRHDIANPQYQIFCKDILNPTSIADIIGWASFANDFLNTNIPEPNSLHVINKNIPTPNPPWVHMPFIRGHNIRILPHGQCVIEEPIRSDSLFLGQVTPNEVKNLIEASRSHACVPFPLSFHIVNTLSLTPPLKRSL